MVKEVWRLFFPPKIRIFFFSTLNESQSWVVSFGLSFWCDFWGLCAMVVSPCISSLMFVSLVAALICTVNKGLESCVPVTTWTWRWAWRIPCARTRAGSTSSCGCWCSVHALCLWLVTRPSLSKDSTGPVGPSLGHNIGVKWLCFVPEAGGF